MLRSLSCAYVSASRRRNSSVAPVRGCVRPACAGGADREPVHRGHFEVILHAPRVYRLLFRLAGAARRERPDVAIVTDAPGFHIDLCRFLKRQGFRSSGMWRLRCGLGARGGSGRSGAWWRTCCVSFRSSRSSFGTTAFPTTYVWTSVQSCYEDNEIAKRVLAGTRAQRREAAGCSAAWQPPQRGRPSPSTPARCGAANQYMHSRRLRLGGRPHHGKSIF